MTQDVLSALKGVPVADLEPKTDLERKALVTMVALVEDRGVEGIALAVDAIKKLRSEKMVTAEVIEALGLRGSSDLLAELEKAEQEDREAVVEFVTKVGNVLGPVFKALLLSLL